MKNLSFIIGNGKSRSNINLESIVGVAPIYGCNALYRDFDGWNVLVAIDFGMRQELRERVEVENHQRIHTPWELYESWDSTRKKNAGMVAMEESIKSGANKLYCLGFDFIMRDTSVSLSNIYENTDNYDIEICLKDITNRVEYFEKFANKHKDISFVFVVPDNLHTRDISAPNVDGISVTSFNKQIQKYHELKRGYRHG